MNKCIWVLGDCLKSSANTITRLIESLDYLTLHKVLFFSFSRLCIMMWAIKRRSRISKLHQSPESPLCLVHTTKDTERTHARAINAGEVSAWRSCPGQALWPIGLRGTFGSPLQKSRQASFLLPALFPIIWSASGIQTKNSPTSSPFSNSLSHCQHKAPSYHIKLYCHCFRNLKSE